MVIRGTTKVVGVIGHPVGHSRSPAMHNAAFTALGLDYVYVAFDVAPEALEGAIQGMRSLGILGLNVTIPHKPAVYHLVEQLAPSARAVEAVNTIHFHENVLTGHNTDAEGFARPLERMGLSLNGQKVVLLGAGGAARSVAAACLNRGAAEITILNRTREKAGALAARLRQMLPSTSPPQRSTGSHRRLPLLNSQLSTLDAQRSGTASNSINIETGTLEEGEAAVRFANLVVQCTNLGMHPHEDDPLPVPEEWLHEGMVVYDLIYNPQETRFLKAGRAAGARVLNGVEMLVQQGAVAFEIWTGVAAPVDVMRDALLAAGQ